MDVSSLQNCYLDSCRRHEVLPNSTVLSWFSKAKVQKSCQEKCNIAVYLNQLKNDDIPPLIDIFPAIDSSDIDAVDILHHGSTPVLNEEFILSLMNAIKLKLQVVDLSSTSLKKDFLWDLCHVGLPCRVLNLRSCHIQKLDMVGRFMQLHTLNLDFCTSLTSLQKDCFSHMLNLTCLSMCETRVANLWTTTAVLAKLPSLLELRFQNCLCCKDTGPCHLSSSEKEKLNNKKDCSNVTNICSYGEELSVDTGCDTLQTTSADEMVIGFLSLQESSTVSEVHREIDDSSEVDEPKISGYLQNLLEASTNPIHNLRAEPKLQREIYFSQQIQNNAKHPLNVLKQASKNVSSTLNKDIWHHPSPICFEKHYREFMVASLPRLAVLDNLPITKMERETSKIVFSENYEYLPYKHNHKKSVVNILQSRETGTSGIYCRNSSKLKQTYCYGKSQCFFSRSLSSARFGSSMWPFLHLVSSFSHISKDENKRHRPRQFEYHPSNSSLMAFGTLDGEIVVINHETGNLVGYNSSIGMMNSVLGLCWLKKYPSKLVAGSDDGCLKLFDVNHMPAKLGDASYGLDAVNFEDFEQLTSVHVNSTDDQFLASGYSKGVALYDISSGSRLQMFTNMHREPINVAKFAHHSPFMFATSSFDKDVKMWDLRERPERPCFTSSSSRGNVMVCFSPDDLYLLVSAIDNEVKQLLAVDGRLHMNFNITSTGSAHNYTRSYYMNGRDYIISGSCDEHVVRICCAQTGRRLRDVYIEGMESGNSIFVQSLRGDPFRHFNFSVLTTSVRPTSKQEIIKVNLLASSHYADESSHDEGIYPSCGLGG